MYSVAVEQMELFEEDIKTEPEEPDYSDSKVKWEIHRLKGFLRFSPDENGVYTARCAPEYYILPALAWHFTRRFGQTPWAIIDEKRSISLYCQNGGPARLIPLPLLLAGKEPEDSWEELWRLHHRALNNEARKNPHLQQHFMPKRYHKYLPELNP